MPAHTLTSCGRCHVILVKYASFRYCNSDSSVYVHCHLEKNNTVTNSQQKIRDGVNLIRRGSRTVFLKYLHLIVIKYTFFMFFLQSSGTLPSVLLQFELPQFILAGYFFISH